MRDRLESTLRSIGANVRNARLRAKLTQADVAGAAELDLRFLQRIERGTTNLSVAVLVSLSAALGVPVPALFQPAELPPARRGRPPGNHSKDHEAAPPHRPRR